jgi:hypothetical protein
MNTGNTKPKSKKRINGRQTCEGKGLEVVFFKLKTNINMKHKFSINRLPLAFASLLLSAVLFSGCNSEYNNKQGIKVDYISSYGEGRFKYQCSQFHSWGTVTFTFIDDANKYNVGDTLWLGQHCR